MAKKNLKIDASKHDMSKVAVGTPDTPKAEMQQGTAVEITHGDIPSDDCTTTESNAAGVNGHIDGAPYVAQEGPNRGKVIQPVRASDGSILGVPADRVVRKTATKASKHFALGANVSQDRWDQIFGKNK